MEKRVLEDVEMNTKRIKTEAFTEVLKDLRQTKGWGETYATLFPIMEKHVGEMPLRETRMYFKVRGTPLTEDELPKLGVSCKQLCTKNALSFCYYLLDGWIKVNDGELDTAFWTNKATAAFRKKLALPREEWLMDETSSFSRPKGKHYRSYQKAIPYTSVGLPEFQFGPLLREHNTIAGYYMAFGTYTSDFEDSIRWGYKEKELSVETIRKRVVANMQADPVIRDLLLTKYGSEDANKLRGKKKLVDFFADVLDTWVHS
jgi:hypothetical protein